jgi:hypothetical protein
MLRGGLGEALEEGKHRIAKRGKEGRSKEGTDGLLVGHESLGDSLER